MLIAKLNERQTKLLRSSGKTLNVWRDYNGEVAFCNALSGVPKRAVDADSIQSDHALVRYVLKDGQVMEPTEALLSKLLELCTHRTNKLK